MKIQEVAEQTGFTVHTIRYYEKEGLLDRRHVQREANNYRNYSDAAIERLKLIRKFQGIGFSLADMKDILQDRDNHTRTNQEVIEWICQKIEELEWKKHEMDQMLDTLHRMVAFRRALAQEPQKVNAV